MKLLALKDGLTLLNLASGFASLVAALRGEFLLAGGFIALGLVFDAADGRVARAVRGDNGFGKELDSLADVVSFGVAPAFLAVAAWGGSWVAVCGALYACAAAVRLAKFNIQTAKGVFYGLPSPAAAVLAAIAALFSPAWFAVAGVLFVLAFAMLADFRVPKI